MEPVSIALLALAVPAKAVLVAVQNVFIALMLADIIQEKFPNIMKVQQKKEHSVTELALEAYNTLSEIFTDNAHHTRMTGMAQTALSTVKALFFEEVQPERTLADLIESATHWTKEEFEGDDHIPADTEGDLAFVCYCVVCLSLVLTCVYLLMYVCSLRINTTMPKTYKEQRQWGKLITDIKAAAARGLPESCARCT